MEILNKILERPEFKKHERIKDFSIKIYEDSDFEKLMELYDRVFPSYMSKELFEWKNNMNPFGNFLSLIMLDKDRIISAYNMEPKEFCVNGISVICLQSVDTMTDPNYQGRGIISYLGNFAYEYAKKLGYKFVYGFPNKFIYKLREKRLNWIIFGRIDLLLKEINQISTESRLNHKYQIQKIDKFNNKIDLFWLNIKNKFPVIIKKDKKYLNWRFSEHPLVKYDKFYVLNNENEELISYFVLKKFKDHNGIKFGHIVDFIISPQEENRKNDIFKLIENYTTDFFKETCSKISFWVPEKNLKRYIQQKFKYDIIKMETYFGYKPFNYIDKLSFLRHFDNWYITMSNEDIF